MTAHKPGQLPKAASVVAQLPWEVLRHLAGQHLVTHWAKTIESWGYTKPIRVLTAVARSG